MLDGLWPFPIVTIIVTGHISEQVGSVVDVGVGAGGVCVAVAVGVTVAVAVGVGVPVNVGVGAGGVCVGGVCVGVGSKVAVAVGVAGLSVERAATLARQRTVAIHYAGVAGGGADSAVAAAGIRIIGAGTAGAI